jgi:hypothetical protein
MNPIPILEVNHQIDPLDLSEHSDEHNWSNDIEMQLQNIEKNSALHLLFVKLIIFI